MPVCECIGSHHRRGLRNESPGIALVATMRSFGRVAQAQPKASNPMRSASRRRQGAVALLLLIIAFVVPINPARAASTDPTQSALDWLTRELSNNGHRIPSPFGDEFTDWGLTIDFLLGLAGGGRTTAPETVATTNNVLANTLSYVTGVDFGSPNDRYAGPMAKLLYATKILGVDSSNLGGLNIESELRARMQTTGPQAGRFSDLADFGDFSNGFGQAFALLALARTSGGIPSEAVTFLLAQQCPGGGFRLFYDSGDTCASDSEADPDATGLTIEALVTTGAPGGSTAASRAVSWLVARQDASGAVGGAGPTVALNANTTAIVGRALRIAGQTGAADKAGAWLLSLQLTQANVGTGPAAPDIGVISYDVASRDTSIANGVPLESRDQFRRATSQGVLAFPKITLPPVVNAPPGGTTNGANAPTGTASISTDAAAPGDKVTVSGTGFNPGETVDFIMHSEPVLLGSVTSDAKGVATLAFTVPAKAEVGLHTIDMIGQTSGKALKTSLQVTQQSTTSTSTTVAATTTVAPTTTVSSSAAPTVAPTTVPSGSDELPVTGSDASRTVPLAATLILLGLVLAALASRRVMRDLG
jgi:hypothetical protein